MAKPISPNGYPKAWPTRHAKARPAFPIRSAKGVYCPPYSRTSGAGPPRVKTLLVRCTRQGVPNPSRHVVQLVQLNHSIGVWAEAREAKNRLHEVPGFAYSAQKLEKVQRPC